MLGKWKSRSGFLLLVYLLTQISGCAETPVKSEKYSFIIEQPSSTVHSVILKFFVLDAARIDKKEPDHIVAFYASAIDAYYGDHGFMAHVWLDSKTPKSVKVTIDTASVGRVQSSKSDGYIFERLRGFVFDYFRRNQGVGS